MSTLKIFNIKNHTKTITNNLNIYRIMKTTRKEIYRIYGKENVILLGYCEIQYIQNYLTKVGHTERVEGWAANVFELPAPYNNIAICTGYAPFGTKKQKCAQSVRTVGKIVL